MECCDAGYELGFRTYVLQGGEDPYFTDERICDMVSAIKERHPDCAVTLSIGEKERASYQAYYNAGAERYLLRHETADEAHYRKLHPQEMSLEHRKRCLYDLKEIGYQTGCGFMVGFPGATVETLYEEFAVYQGTDAAYGWNRTVYPAEGYSIWRAGTRYIGADLTAAFYYPAHPSACAAAVHDGAWYDPSAWQGKRHPGGGKCGDAEFIPGQCPGKIQAVRQ